LLHKPNAFAAQQSRSVPGKRNDAGIIIFCVSHTFKTTEL
jgi:hypothetical protein